MFLFILYSDGIEALIVGRNERWGWKESVRDRTVVIRSELRGQPFVLFFRGVRIGGGGAKDFEKKILQLPKARENIMFDKLCNMYDFSTGKNLP